MSETSTTTNPTDMRSVEGRGNTVDEAIEQAVAELGATREQVVIEILSQPAAGIPGERLSVGEARVRAMLVDERTARGRQLLEELLAKMDISARVAVRTASNEPGAPMVLDVSGDDLGLLIGWRGETLRALQTVINLMMGDEDQEARRLIVDVERYRARREEQVRDLALRLAQRVKRSGERYTLDPMQPYERRAVHLALSGDDGVRTESSGKEPARRIVIHPTGPANPDIPEVSYGAPRSPRRGGSDRGGSDRGGWRDRG